MRNNLKEVEEKEGKLFMGKERDKERIQEVTGKKGRGWERFNEREGCWKDLKKGKGVGKIQRKGRL